jgi:hypothetical protein
MLGPVSRRVAGCTCLFLPPRRRPSPSPAGGSASRIDPLRDFTAAGISRSSPFLTFRPPGLFATQVSPTAADLNPQGSRDFYARAEHAPLPLRASGMLAVRTRQLTAEDFHLLDLQPCRPLPGLEPVLPCGKRILSRRGKGGESRTFESCLVSLPFPVYESYEECSTVRGLCRSRDAPRGAPPPQIPASGTTAPGSHLR